MSVTTTTPPTLTPPANTLSADRWADFPNTTAPTQYLIETEDGKSHTVTVSKNMRRILEALMVGPVYCASRCRIGVYVHLMRKDKQIDIVTDEYREPGSGLAWFGVFRLNCKVTRIKPDNVVKEGGAL